MKLNDNRGITLISLAIATLVIIVISGAIIFNTRNQISLRDINYLYQDIQTLNGRIDDYYVKYGTLPVLCEYLDKTALIESIRTRTETMGASISGGLITNPNDNDKYYVIELEKLGGITLNYGYDNDYQSAKDAVETNNLDAVTSLTKIYIVNEKTHQVYFPNGIFADNIMYCTYKIETDIPQIVKPAERKAQIEIGDYVNYTYDTADNIILNSNITRI